MGCERCSQDTNSMVSFTKDGAALLVCRPCHALLTDKGTSGQSAGVITDEIPGGIEIRHGICNPDGTPKRYYSKTEIKRAANERGYTIAGDTPKPYNVGWSGKQKRIDGVK